MPKGVYVRTKPAWNKGNVSQSNNMLLDAVRELMTNSATKLSPTRIHKMLAIKGILPGDKNGYMRLDHQIVKACQSGRLDSSQICNDRGQKGCLRQYARKFAVGDRVRIIRQNRQTPLWLRKELRIDNVRTIIAAIPSKAPNGHVSYYLGNNGIGKNYLGFYAFQSYELEYYRKKTIVGRPSSKRKYTKHCRDTSAVQDGLSVNPSELPSILCVNFKNELVGVC
jgi:hypothetical protein